MKTTFDKRIEWAVGPRRPLEREYLLVKRHVCVSLSDEEGNYIADKDIASQADSRSLCSNITFMLGSATDGNTAVDSTDSWRYRVTGYYVKKHPRHLCRCL